MITPPRRLASAYRAGATTRDLAEDHGVDRKTIWKWLRAAGVELRPRGPKELPVTDDEIVELVEHGWSWGEIADQVGMSRSGVRGRYRRIQGLDRWR